MPLVLFSAISVVLQALNLLFTLAIETYASKAASVTTFALLYMVVFWIAWRITVLIVDSWRNRVAQAK